jgi:hypothetical protein
MHGKKNKKLLMYLLTAIGLTPGGSSAVHFYTKTIHITNTNNTQKKHKYIEQHKQYIEQHKQYTEQSNWEHGPCPGFASYTLAYALQLRKKHGKTSLRVAEECQLAR